MKFLDRLALLLVVIGGVHLLLVGFGFNVFDVLLGPSGETITDVVYIIIGISALWCIKYFNYTPKGGSRLKDR